jgi:hypothetical protein
MYLLLFLNKQKYQSENKHKIKTEKHIKARFTMYVFIGKLKKKKKGCFAPLCVPLGLNKPGDFTVSEGHGHPLNIFSALFWRAAQGFFFLFSPFSGGFAV